MRPRSLAVACLLTASLLLGLPGGVDGQLGGLGLAARMGTTGFGAEAAIGLGERVVFRGGVGFSTLDVSTTFDSLPVQLDMPRDWFNMGVDYYLNSAFRVGTGVVFRPQDVEVSGSYDGPIDIGGETLTPAQLGRLDGTIVNDHMAPYALVGFGKHVLPGLGLSLDVGAAWFGTPEVSLSATGGSYPVADLAAALQREEDAFQRDMKTYMSVWPILRLGLRYGFGRSADEETEEGG